MRILFLLFYLLLSSLEALEKDIGTQVILDLYECDKAKIDNLPYIEYHMTKATKDSGGTIVTKKFHKFSPWGVSGVVVIQESHLAIHTWPEFNYAAIDIFSCSPKLELDLVCHLLIKAFESKDYKINIFKRGKK